VKCLNKKCGSLEADELNVSVNVSVTSAEKAEPEYEGWTEYGDDLIPIGTVCPICEQQTIAKSISKDVRTLLGYLP